MATKRIVIDPFDPSTYDVAIEHAEAMGKRLSERGQKICLRLAEIGKSEAETHFTPEAGNSDVTLSVVPTAEGAELIAEGDDLYFMEFGAGTQAGAGYDTGTIEPPVEITPGSYSGSLGTGKFIKDGYWHYGGQRMDAITPQMGMYHAYKASEAQAQKVAEEVLND